MQTLRTPDDRFTDLPDERAHHCFQEDAAPQLTQIVLDAIRSS